MCLLSKFIEFNWQFITGISTIVIAVCALAFSIWQGMQTRKHNKLSVRPHLTAWVKRDAVKRFYSIELINNGIGPALIEEFLIKVDDKVIAGKGIEQINKVWDMIFPNFRFNHVCNLITKGDCIAAKEKVVFMEIHFLQEPFPTFEFLENA